MTVLPLPFQFGYLLFIFLVWLLWLELPILCWTEVARVGILVLLQILVRRLSASFFFNLRKLETHRFSKINEYQAFFLMKNLAWHIKIKLLKSGYEDKILKSAREKDALHRRTNIRMTSDFSSKTVQNQRQWRNIFKVMKEIDCQPKILYPVKIYFKNNAKKFFSNIKRWKKIISSRPT